MPKGDGSSENQLSLPLHIMPSAKAQEHRELFRLQGHNCPGHRRSCSFIAPLLLGAADLGKEARSLHIHRTVMGGFGRDNVARRSQSRNVLQEGSEARGRGSRKKAVATLQNTREVPPEPGQSRLGLMPAGKYDRLWMQTQICQTIVKAGESGLPFIVNQQTKGAFASVALLLLPGPELE